MNGHDTDGNGHPDDWRYIFEPDLCCGGQSFSPMSPEAETEAWRKTVEVLGHLCGMADSLHLEPLILALGAALARSEESLKRAQRREWKRGGATG